MDSATRAYVRAEIDRKIREGRAAEVRMAKGQRNLKAPTNPLRSKGTMLDARKFWKALKEHADQNGWGDTENAFASEVANRTGYDTRRITQMMREKRVTFDVADFIVTKVWVHLWYRHPVLREMYDAVDFRYYDPGFRQQEDRKRKQANDKRNRRDAPVKKKLRGAQMHEERMARLRGAR